MKKCLSTLYYADDGISFLDLGFENDVNMYGTQAPDIISRHFRKFENDVNMYGTQAIQQREIDNLKFENDVNMYGTQAHQHKLLTCPLV